VAGLEVGWEPVEHGRAGEHLELVSLEVDSEVLPGQALLGHRLGQRLGHLSRLRHEEGLRARRPEGAHL